MLGRLDPPLRLAALACALACGLSWGGRIGAEVAAEARSAGDVFERKAALADALLYVASDLKVRFERDPSLGPAILLLLVDPTTSMQGELRLVLATLERLWGAGPRGMRIGVHAAGAESVAPTGIPSEVASVLRAALLLPNDAPKGLHEEVRRAAAALEQAGAGPRALVLLTKEAGDAEDDVEATREALLDAGVAFYAIGPEAAFERPWEYDFEPNDHPAQGLSERFHPEPRKRAKGSYFVGSEVAFGLVPYVWEQGLAQTTFVWVRPPAWPVPSGFGYWNLATLAFSSGGRYFVFDFAAAAAAAAGRGDARRTLYDYARLRLLAPDLRPREKVLKDLDRDPRAVAVVRIWQMLADEAAPVLQDLPTLEVKGTTLAPRTARPVRSAWTPRVWFEDEDQVRADGKLADGRIAVLEKALALWSAVAAKDRGAPAGAPPHLVERVEADFQLLGVQLLKVRFAWTEYRRALREIRPLDLSYRRVRLLAVPLALGVSRPVRPERLPDEEREAQFAQVMAAQARVAEKYPGTPWSLLLEKGVTYTFRKDVQVIEVEDPRPEKPPRPEAGTGKPAPSKAPSPPQPAAPPPPGPRPGSGGSGPVTGG